MKEEENNRKTASVIFVITNGIRQDPTCFWETRTKKFERFLFSQKISTEENTGHTVKIAVIKERRGDSRWISEFMLITEHDLHNIHTFLKRFGKDISPDHIVVIGRKHFLSRFSPKNDRPGSRYHWTGNNYPFGWTMYLDRDGERLNQLVLASLANEIASVFMINFEEELAHGRLNAAKRT